MVPATESLNLSQEKKKSHQDSMGKHNKQKSQHIQSKPLSSFSQGKTFKEGFEGR